MKLHIILTSHKATLELKEGSATKTSSEFDVDNNLSQNLLVEIDTLLKKVKVEPMEIEKVEYEAQEAGFTTTRIGQAVANAYNYALRQ